MNKKVILFSLALLSSASTMAMHVEVYKQMLITMFLDSQNAHVEAHQKAGLFCELPDTMPKLIGQTQPVLVWASVLESQRLLINDLRVYANAIHQYEAIGRDLDTNYPGFVYEITLSDGQKMLAVAVQRSPDAMSAQIFLNRLINEHASVEEIIKYITAFNTQEPALQAALKVRLRNAYGMLRDQVFATIAPRLEQLIAEVSPAQLSPIAGYCYPCVQLNKIVMNYLVVLRRQMAQHTFSDDDLTPQDQEYHTELENLIAWYDTRHRSIDTFYNTVLKHVQKTTHKPFHRNLFADNSILRPIATVVAQPPTIELPEIDTEFLALLKGRSQSKSTPHKDRRHKRHSPSAKRAGQSCHIMATEAESSPTETDDDAQTPCLTPSPEPVYSWRYAKRTLEWHDGQESFALINQGYTQTPHTQEELDHQVIYHRLPFVIEERFSHLAEVTHHRDHPTDDTLNFPGAIQYADGTMEYGIFSIAVNSKNNYIYHRNFTVHAPMQLQNMLQTCLQTVPAPDQETDYAALPSDAEHRYTIEENRLTVRIKDAHGVTYVLFKGHKMAVPTT